MNALVIPTGNAAIVELATALGRERALDERESRILQRAIIRDQGAFRRWTPADDAKLLKMHKARIRAAQMATTLNRTEDAVRRRLCDLKKARRYG
ncbi:hypothetical protein [Sphingomonas sp.]|uniref:hypothetical protein n=1 Tax=Sphingomonas sp. TaxID=28214 RepID=UPI0031DD2394